MNGDAVIVSPGGRTALVALDARTGAQRWRTTVSGGEDAAYASTVVAAAGGGLLRLAAGSGGAAGTPVYFAKRLGVAQGGAVRIGSHVYAATGQGLQAIDWATGRIAWQARGIGTAALAAAEGRLYLHGENGDVALVEANPASYQERGRFTPANRPDLGSAKAWAHPVVANGRLYLRQAGVLWAYDIAGRAR